MYNQSFDSVMYADVMYADGGWGDSVFPKKYTDFYDGDSGDPFFPRKYTDFYNLSSETTTDTDTDTDLYDYDSITSATTSTTCYNPQTVVVITGERIKDPLWSRSDSGWGGPNISGGGVFLPPRNAKTIDLMQHLEDFVMGMVTSASDPWRKNLATNVLQTGANIFTEMMNNSRIGDIGMSQLAIP